MLEMEAAPQKTAKGALMRRDIWEWLQVHWLHAREILQNHCQRKFIPVLWMHVVHEDKSVGNMGPHLEMLFKLTKKMDGPLVLCSSRQLLALLSPGLGLPTRKAGSPFDLAQQEGPHGLSDKRS